MTNYASLQETEDPEDGGIMYHRPEPTRSKWNHIVDLDSFFTRVYNYHQNHGFVCMLLKEILKINQFVFVVLLSMYLIHGIDYAVLFHYGTNSPKKPTLNDVILSLSQCIGNFTGITWVFIILAVVYLVLKILLTFYQMICFWDIKQFYNKALGIEDKELDNMTWHDVQMGLKDAQYEHQMCIHKMELTELDIYHRILRHKNYLVALVNKRLLPPRLHIPFLGEVVYWSNTLQYNILGVLFWSPFSLFGDPYEQHPEYKKFERRHYLSKRLGRQILWLAVINLILAPLILVWHLTYTFFHYAELIKREPGKIGIRKWSLYGKLYVRHFNELDHELNARLGRAYQPITRYMASFTSPVVSIVAEHVQFLCGAIFAVIVGLTIYDEDVLAVENVLTIMTGLGAVIALCRGAIPDPSMVWCPELLLQNVVMHTHYLPPNWRNNAHTSEVRSEVQQIFQYRFVALLEEILSPYLTPYVLLRWVYPRSLDIVDFSRNFTVYVEGVGNVCSFAEMDVAKHGDPEWQKQGSDASLPVGSQAGQAEDGKLEMSLIHFTNTNPSWVPQTQKAQQFVSQIQDDVPALYEEAMILNRSNNYDSPSLANFFAPSVMNMKKNARSSVVSGTMPNTRKTVYASEGPDMMTPVSMTSNVLTLLTINNEKQEGRRPSQSSEEKRPSQLEEKRPSQLSEEKRPSQLSEETTPLLQKSTV